ncbi:Bcr/CflA family efflux MFS transporter [Sphingomonas sp. PL-96]|uniref:Bcr/CflA family efflux MFS transporter n=1 Tax=Sphingomonas sp. PL-96 TaxID=2887201 RepID=UPI001E5E0775|nr:Bcr/CflA family efflux MFS transporter [Sphingomonas sp. PL-96]MCC2976848.1 Bcr/CflA family efflux MFS transporter [Sphingomonas sp. PL-96]
MNTRGLSFTVFLGALSALPPLSIDMGLPGVPAIEAGMPGAAGRGALTLSLFLAGFALSPLACGPLADRFGRRKTTAVGLFAFVLAATACVFAQSFSLLLGCRLVQGIAAGACVIMPLAIVRDVFDGNAARHHLSRITAVVGLAPMLAPLLGGWVMAAGGWRAIYAAQAACGIALLATTLLLFAETLPASRRRSLNPRALLAGYASVVRDRGFRGNTLLYAFAFAAMFSFISSAPAVLMGRLGLSPAMFGLAFAISSCGTLLGSLLSGRLNARDIAGHTLVDAGIAGLVAACLVLLALTLAGVVHVYTVVPVVAVAIFCFGLLGPSANHDALHNLAGVAGSASGILRCTQMVLGALASALVAYFSPLADPTLTMAGLMAAASLAAAACLVRLRVGTRRASSQMPAGDLQ